MNPAIAIFKRDLMLAFRSGGGALQGIVFFALILSLLGVALGTDRVQLTAAAPALIWVSVLLALTLSFERIFETDHRDGSLAIMCAGHVSALPIVLGKAASYACIALLPLLLLSPVAGALYGLPSSDTAKLVLTLLIAAPALIGYGMLAAACLIGVPNAGFTVALLALPLLLPTLIFALSAVESTTLTSPSILALAGVSAIALPLGLWGACAALKTYLET